MVNIHFFYSQIDRLFTSNKKQMLEANTPVETIYCEFHICKINYKQTLKGEI